MGDQYAAPNPSNNLTIPKGILYVAPWDGDTPPAESDFVDVGNASAVSVEPTREKLEHYSSRSGTKTKDRTAEISSGYNANFTLDEMSMANMAMFLRATITADFLLANENIGGFYALRFISDNSYGRNFSINCWKVEIAPEGALPLIGDEWMTMGFSGEGLDDTLNHPTSKFFTMRFTDAYASGTTTSTTSSTTTSTAS